LGFEVIAMQLNVKKIVVGALRTNCYIAYDLDSKAAFIVDPGYPDPKILNFIKNINLLPIFIINTHGHFDHIAGDEEVAHFFNIPVLIHLIDLPMLIDPSKNYSAYYGTPFAFSGQWETINGEGTIEKSPFHMTIIETPGHTCGSISILIGNYLFSGDTLFIDTIGRTDLPESCPDKMAESLLKFKNISDDIVVHPGHMGSGKFSEVKARNRHLNFR